MIVREGIVLVFAALLVGCSSAAKEAEERYNALAATNASSDALCDAAQGVATAWQVEGDQTRAAIYSNIRDAHCISAQACRRTIGGC